jgi:hypothetical protein
MFCPGCGDEFREGFTRCGRCDLDLVAEPPTRPAAGRPDRPATASWVDYCGFFALDDARRARDDLRGAGIRSEILIREPPDGDHEEYWLRVDSERIAEVPGILGEVPRAAAPPEGDSFNCSECGETVGADESTCPHCGARFEDAG